jgi:HEAT repeat protein
MTRTAPVLTAAILLVAVPVHADSLPVAPPPRPKLSPAEEQEELSRVADARKRVEAEIRAANAKAAKANVADPVPPPRAKADTDPAALLPNDPKIWLPKLTEGYAHARRHKQPILVKVGSASCPWCRKLDGELRETELAKELVRWTLVSLDVATADRDARALAVGPIPALRVLSPDGRVVASRDGFLPATELLEWLRKHHDAAAVLPAEELTATGAPDDAAVGRLVGELKQRDPALREAAIRRLLPHPKIAAKPVAESFAKGSLQSRLAAMELLREWQAPVAELDPWRPETLTAVRLEALAKWAVAPPEPKPTEARELTAAERDTVRQDLARLIVAPDAEAAAIRERLARHGPALLPEVYAAHKDAATDTARERLTALRYRVAAGDALALRWPGGIDRLASTKAAVRHEAVQELARRATAADEPLLLELFGNPDPFVRELSLRTLHAVAGHSATGALAKLLHDPDPNVRAAVLKQMAENPSTTSVPKIAEYIAGESDPDLVVHAIRVLRAAKGDAAIGHLKPLLKHASWRVRADSAEAIGEVIGPSYSQSVKGEVRQGANAALREALGDTDGFVVGRAIGALKKADDPASIEPLVKAAAAHPELAPEVIAALNYGSSAREKALPHLREFCRHKDPAVRAAAIAAACYGASEVLPELRAGLTDPVAVVREAAAAEVFRSLNGTRLSRASDQERLVQLKPSEPVNSEPVNYDAPAADLRAGKGRAKGFDDLTPLLEPILKSTDTAERLEAGLALIALGRDAAAVPVVFAAAGTDMEFVGRASRALPWLPWADRLDLFGKLLALQPHGEPLEELIRHFVEVPDPRAAKPLWEVVARDGATPEGAGEIASALRRLAKGGDRYDGIRDPNDKAQAEPPTLKPAVEEAKTKAHSGPELQRAVALAVLANLNQTAAAEAAAAVYDDPASSPGLRRDALQVMLLTRPGTEATAAAVKALKDPEPVVRRPAVVFLCLGSSAIQHIRDRHIYLSLNTDQGIPRRGSGGGVARYVPKVPAGLERDAVRKLAADTDPITAAGAGYLLALLGDPAGLPALVRYWREWARDDGDWVRLVAMAVASLDDDARVPILGEVYRELTRESSDRRDMSLIRDFYWTIRPLAGPNALRLRKAIRDEIGMGALGSPDNSSDAPNFMRPN